VVVWLTNGLKLDSQPHAFPCKRGAWRKVGKPRFKDLTAAGLKILLRHQYRSHALVASFAASQQV
jgi:hypothetical protein